MFSKSKIQELMSKFSQVNVNDIQDSSLRAKAAKLKKKQGGFTLLELLVVVAILAAIAGTASIALQDTDARASAAAHVAMMDELNKGIRTFRVLNKNTLPTGFDSLVQTATADVTDTAALLSVGAANENLALVDMPNGVADILDAGGINSLQYVTLDGAPEGGPNCSNLSTVIASRANAVVAGNIFMSPAANGCGYTFTIADSDATADGIQLSDTPKIAVWTGGYERVMGAAGAGFDASGYTGNDRPALMAVGLGPSSNLFNANDLGGMTSVPVYRHVGELEYNRFIALFNIGTLNDAGTVVTAGDQVVLSAIVDGAGDTKEEELGEWDGTRNTI